MLSGLLRVEASRIEATRAEELDMSTIIVEQRRPPTVARPFSGRARWAAAALLVTGAALQVAEFLLAGPLNDTTARVAYWEQHLARIGVSMAVGLLAVPFLIGWVAVIVALARVRSPRLAWTAGRSMVCAMVGLAAVHGAEMMAYGLVRAGNPAAAVTVLEASNVGLPAIVLFVLFLGGAALGTVTMSIAMWRSPLVPRIAPVLILAFSVIDFALRWGVISHVMALLAGAVLAWAVLTDYSRQPKTAGQ
jgi:hypothetical protein